MICNKAKLDSDGGKRTEPRCLSPHPSSVLHHRSFCSPSRSSPTPDSDQIHIVVQPYFEFSSIPSSHRAAATGAPARTVLSPIRSDFEIIIDVSQVLYHCAVSTLEGVFVESTRSENGERLALIRQQRAHDAKKREEDKAAAMFEACSSLSILPWR